MMSLPHVPIPAFIFKRKKSFSTNDIPDVRNFPSTRRAVVTGSNTGIGYETARELANKGWHVIIAARDPEKGNKAIKTIQAELGNRARLEYRRLDLADLSSVRSFAFGILDDGKPLHALINNAGLMLAPFSRTKDDLERTWVTNYLGPFLLTNLLTPAIVRAAQNDGHGRIVNVGSEAHRWAPGSGVELNQTVVMNPGNYHTEVQRWMWYGHSKSAMLIFTRELSSKLRETNVWVNCVHPGLIESSLFREAGVCFPPFFGRLGRLAKAAARPWMRSSANGALPILYAATSPEIAEKRVTGEYIVPCRGWKFPWPIRFLSNLLVLPATGSYIPPGIFIEPWTTGSSVDPITGTEDLRTWDPSVRRQLMELSNEQVGWLDSRKNKHVPPPVRWFGHAKVAVLAAAAVHTWLLPSRQPLGPYQPQFTVSLPFLGERPVGGGDGPPPPKASAAAAKRDRTWEKSLKVHDEDVEDSWSSSEGESEEARRCLAEHRQEAASAAP